MTKFRKAIREHSRLIDEMRNYVWKPENPIGKKVCDHCNIKRTKEGHDGCLGTLSGVINACCNHGGTGEGAYVVFKDGGRLSGSHATDYFKFVNKPKPKTSGAARNGVLELLTILGHIEYNWHKPQTPQPPPPPPSHTINDTKWSFNLDQTKDLTEGFLTGYAAVCAVVITIFLLCVALGIINFTYTLTLLTN